jgi:hypothetical protein
LPLTWLRHFYAQRGEGIWYPRWIAGTNSGYRSPTFVIWGMYFATPDTSTADHAGCLNDESAPGVPGRPPPSLRPSAPSSIFRADHDLNAVELAVVGPDGRGFKTWIAPPRPVKQESQATRGVPLGYCATR